MNKPSLKELIISGFLVLLPTAILALLFFWIYNFFAGIFSPLIGLIGAKQNIIANLLVILAISLLSLSIGIIIKSNIGRKILHFLEKNTLYYIPGYVGTKRTLELFVNANSKDAKFLSVALVDIYHNNTFQTSFITEEHDNGMITVFIPTAPNPTSGYIYHINKKYVKKVDIPVETAFRSIIAAGKGSKPLITAFSTATKHKIAPNKKHTPTPNNKPTHQNKQNTKPKKTQKKTFLF